MYNFYYVQMHVITAEQFIVAVMCLIFFRQRALEIKMIGVAAAIGVLSFFSMGAFNLRGMEVNIPTNIGNIMAFAAVWLAYYAAFNRRYPKTFLVVGVAYLCFAVANIMFVQKMNFNTYSVIVSSSLTIGASVFYFYRLLIDLPVQHLQRMPWFYISAGYLVDSASTFFLYLFQPYLQKYFFDDVLLYWVFHDLLTVIQLVAIIVGVGVDLGNLKVFGGEGDRRQETGGSRS